MRYDSTAQTLLNHRPLTIFSGYVPFGKVRNNEINKHSLPPVTAPALWGPNAARLLMRGSVQFPSCRRKKKSLANTARLARLGANQLPDKTLPESAPPLPPSSRSPLLIPSCSNCFCYACSGKIKVSFVSVSQLDKAAAVKRKEKTKSTGGRLSLPNNWRRDVVIQVQFHHSIFYCVSRTAPLFIITCHCVISNSFLHHKQKWFCSMLCSLAAMMSLAMTKALAFVFFWVFLRLQTLSAVRAWPPPEDTDGCSPRWAICSTQKLFIPFRSSFICCTLSSN